MGCRSDYMAPDAQEKFLMRTAELLIYVRKYLGYDVSDTHKRWTESYGSELAVQELCALLQLLGKNEPDVLERILYGDPKDRMARELAIWWEDHQESDKKRLAKEKLEKEEILNKEKNKKIRKNLIKKATKILKENLTADEMLLIEVKESLR